LASVLQPAEAAKDVQLVGKEAKYVHFSDVGNEKLTISESFNHFYGHFNHNAVLLL
jgi:hypothetical protein